MGGLRVNYFELTSSIQTWLDRTDETLVKAIPTFIRLAEASFNRVLRTVWQECRMDVATDPQNLYSLPLDWLGHRFIEIIDNRVHITYYKRIPGLSESTTRNWLCDDHPDIYLYGALASAESWLKNDPRIAIWKSVAGESLDDLMALDEKAKYDGQDLISRSYRHASKRIRYLDSASFADLERGDAPAFTVSGNLLRIGP
jgi:hypothetical protein